MARSSQVLVENNFTRGLVTEATAMAFPENAVVDIDNCDISQRGVVTRRYGIDYETDKTITAMSTITSNVGAITEFNWGTVGETGTVNFVVQQIANKLVFFLEDDTGISPNIKSYTVDMLTYKVAGWADSDVYTTACSMSSGAGYLFVTNPFCEPITIEYNYDTDTITVATLDLSVRDFEGVDDSLGVDERPTTLTALHKYNLYNQGWYATDIDAAGAPTIQVLDRWDAVRADYPANSDVWWLLKNASGEFEPVWRQKAITTSEAPKGHYIFSAFDIDRASVIATTTNTETIYRPSCVEFFAGRAFFSGVNDKKYGSNIYFSQIITKLSDAGKCYQNADPTDENLFDIVDSDGGVIVIAAAGRINRLVSFNAGLLVLADNGIWAISGSDNGPFTPTNYSVTKVSEIGVTGTMTTTTVEGVPVWISDEGIYTLKVSEISRLPEVVSLTKDTIQTAFNDIPLTNLPYMKPCYNSIEKRIIWLYRSVAWTTEAEKYQYDKVLVLDRVSGAFYKHTLTTSLSPKVSGVISINGVDVSGKVTKVFKFFTTGLIGTAAVSAFTYSQFIDTDHIDWYTFNTTGVATSSYFITGYRVRGELLKKFQSNYLVVITSDAEDGSCLVQGLWDYTNTTGNGRYTSSQEVYRPDSTYNYHRCKLKIRGNGYSLQFKFRSNGNAPFTLIGWSTFETGNNVP
jgi:hypothetical protein